MRKRRAQNDMWCPRNRLERNIHFLVIGGVLATHLNAKMTFMATKDITKFRYDDIRFIRIAQAHALFECTIARVGAR